MMDPQFVAVGEPVELKAMVPKCVNVNPVMRIAIVVIPRVYVKISMNAPLEELAISLVYLKREFAKINLLEHILVIAKPIMSIPSHQNRF